MNKIIIYCSYKRTHFISICWKLKPRWDIELGSCNLSVVGDSKEVNETDRLRMSSFEISLVESDTVPSLLRDKNT